MIVVGDIVGDRRRLRLGAGPAVELEILLAQIFPQREGQFGRGRGGIDRVIDEGAVVLGQALERLPGEIEALERRVAGLETGDDAQRLRIVIEAAMGRHRRVELGLAGMAEGRMAEIVGERQRLREILVEAEHAGDRARDLRHLEAVGEPRAVMIAFVIDEDLGLVFEATKGRRVEDAIAVALKDGPRRAFRLGDRGSARDAPHRARAGARGRSDRRSRRHQPWAHAYPLAASGAMRLTEWA